MGSINNELKMYILSINRPEKMYINVIYFIISPFLKVNIIFEKVLQDESLLFTQLSGSIVMPFKHLLVSFQSHFI